MALAEFEVRNEEVVIVAEGTDLIAPLVTLAATAAANADAAANIAVTKAAEAAATVSDVRMSLGEFYDGGAATAGQANGGAILDYEYGRVVGLTIPTGQNGAAAYWTGDIDVSAISQAMVGATIRITIRADMTAGMLADHNINRFEVMAMEELDGTQHGAASYGVHVSQGQVGAVYERVIDYTFEGNERFLKPYLMILGAESIPATSNKTMTPTSITVSIQSETPDFVGTKTDAAVSARAMIAASSAQTWFQVVRAGPGLTFESVQAAIDSIKGVWPGGRALVIVEGHIVEKSIVTRNYIDICLKASAWIEGKLPDNAALIDIEKTSTFDWNTDTEIFGAGRATAQNMRYVFHSDGGDQIRFRYLRMALRGIRAKHLNNDGARAWQSANGGNPDGVWPNEDAVGCGSSSGCVRLIEDCDLEAPRMPVAIHDMANFVMPSTDIVRRSKLRSTNAVPAQRWGLALKGYGSSQPNRIILENNDFGAGRGIRFECDAGDEFIVSGSGNSPVPLTVIGTSDFRTRFSDETTSARNETGADIQKGRICTWDGAFDKVRLLTNADPEGTHAMVAMDDILAGEWGDLKHAGAVLIADLVRGDLNAAVFGSRFSIDPAEPGKIMLGGTPRLPFFGVDFYCIRFRA